MRYSVRKPTQCCERLGPRSTAFWILFNGASWLFRRQGGKLLFYLFSLFKGIQDLFHVGQPRRRRQSPGVPGSTTRSIPSEAISAPWILEL